MSPLSSPWTAQCAHCPRLSSRLPLPVSPCLPTLNKPPFSPFVGPPPRSSLSPQLLRSPALTPLRSFLVFLYVAQLVNPPLPAIWHPRPPPPPAHARPCGPETLSTSHLLLPSSSPPFHTSLASLCPQPLGTSPPPPPPPPPAPPPPPPSCVSPSPPCLSPSSETFLTRE